MYEFIINLAGVRVRVRARFPQTEAYFRRYDPVCPSAVPADPSADHPAHPGAEPADLPPLLDRTVELLEDDWADARRLGMAETAYSEFTMLTGAVSDALMEADRLIIHAVAISWRGRAYLISAPSGTGKSTQFKHLNALRPGEFSVICGDRPVLWIQNGEVTVHPSPWNGKESWHGAPAAPLGGIILLRRGEENRLESPQPREIALELFPQIIQSCRLEEKIRRSAQLETQLLEAAPLWRLTTFRVPDSTELLLEAVFPQ